MCKRILVSQTNTEDGVPFYKIGTIGSTPDAYISKELFDDYKVKYNYPRKGEVMITCAGTYSNVSSMMGKMRISKIQILCGLIILHNI